MSRRRLVIAPCPLDNARRWRGRRLAKPSLEVLEGRQLLAAGSIAFSAASYSVADSAGTIAITLNRTGGSAGSVGVTFATSDGTAKAGLDYTAVSKSVSFPS